MSKIGMTNDHIKAVYEAFMGQAGHENSVRATLDKAIKLGLVRPASDDHATHFKELWESIEGRIKAHDDLAAKVAAVEASTAKLQEIVGMLQLQGTETPDPHAAAKDRAKLLGVELVTLKDGTCLFMTEKHYLSNPKPSWFPHVFSFRSPHYSGGHKTPSEAWSNFPTEPPPGWEAKAEPVCDCGKIEHGRHHSACPAVSKAKPRTDADRLGEVAWKADGGALEGDEWANDRDTSPARRQAYRTIALAVRKADRASQLEPSEEEIDKACNAYLPHYAASTPSVVESVRRGVAAALRAAARVRLEKAEGEG